MIGPGEIALYYQGSPFTLDLPTGLRAIHVCVPRPLLMARVPAAIDLTARTLRNQLSRMTGEMFRQLIQLDVLPNSRAARRLCTSTIDILAAALEWDTMDRPDAGSRRLEQIKRFMLANLHEAELDAERIANANGMAVRSLYRLFAAESSTPMRWLWKQRLDASFAALSDDRVMRVTDVAMSHGFNDLSHFSRLFKSAFGRSPQSLKREGRS